MDSSLSSFPDWVEVDFDGSKTINEIDVVTRQDDLNNPVEPTLTQTFSLYGITAFDVQYWDGTNWTTVSNGSVTGNNKVWRQFTFASVTTSKIRVVVNGGADNAYSRVVEVEAWGSQTAGPIKYVLSDIQGSTRAVMSNNGSSSAIVARHDYLPFGEELSLGLGLRSSSQGYGATDANRQKYGLTERDDATGLDHTWWRKYENLSGRFTSPDPYNGSIFISDPQSSNRYSYTQSDPVNFIDPDGLDPWGQTPGFIPAWMNGWNLTINPIESFFNYVAELTALYHNSGAYVLETHRGLFDGFPHFSFGVGGSPQGWHNVRWTKCPPVQFKVTGIGPNQAPNTTAISQTARADIPNGGVAIKPKNFGVKGVNGTNRSVFLNMTFEVDWSAATPTGTPTGIPTQGPFFPVDNIGPPSVRNSSGNQIDVYNYGSQADAWASTRTAKVTTWIPENTAGVKCPK